VDEVNTDQADEENDNFDEWQVGVEQLNTQARVRAGDDSVIRAPGDEHEILDHHANREGHNQCNKQRGSAYRWA
jgi:hypothetical protein